MQFCHRNLLREVPFMLFEIDSHLQQKKHSHPDCYECQISAILLDLLGVGDNIVGVNPVSSPVVSPKTLANIYANSFRASPYEVCNHEETKTSLYSIVKDPNAMFTVAIRISNFPHVLVNWWFPGKISSMGKVAN